MLQGVTPLPGGPGKPKSPEPRLGATSPVPACAGSRHPGLWAALSAPSQAHRGTRHPANVVLSFNRRRKALQHISPFVNEENEARRGLVTST